MDIISHHCGNDSWFLGNLNRPSPGLGEILSLHRDASSISLDGRGDRRGGARSRRVGLPLHVEEVGAHGVHDVVEHGEYLVEMSTLIFEYFSNS